MSTPAEMPKITLVVAASMPCASAHSGTIACRVDRAADSTQHPGAEGEQHPTVLGQDGEHRWSGDR